MNSFVFDKINNNLGIYLLKYLFIYNYFLDFSRFKFMSLKFVCIRFSKRCIKLFIVVYKNG